MSRFWCSSRSRLCIRRLVYAGKRRIASIFLRSKGNRLDIRRRRYSTALLLPRRSMDRFRLLRIYPFSFSLILFIPYLRVFQLLPEEVIPLSAFGTLASSAIFVYERESRSAVAIHYCGVCIFYCMFFLSGELEFRGIIQAEDEI